MWLFYLATGYISPQQCHPDPRPSLGCFLGQAELSSLLPRVNSFPWDCAIVPAPQGLSSTSQAPPVTCSPVRVPSLLSISTLDTPVISHPAPPDWDGSRARMGPSPPVLKSTGTIESRPRENLSVRPSRMLLLQRNRQYIYTEQNPKGYSGRSPPPPPASHPSSWIPLGTVLLSPCGSLHVGSSLALVPLAYPVLRTELLSLELKVSK